MKEPFKLARSGDYSHKDGKDVGEAADYQSESELVSIQSSPTNGTGKNPNYLKKDLIGLNPSQIINLQSTVGNRAVLRMLERTRQLKNSVPPSPSSETSTQNTTAEVTPDSVLSATVNRASADTPSHASQHQASVIQRVKEDEFQADPEDFMQNNLVLFAYARGFQLRFPKTVEAAIKKLPISELVANLNTLMIENKASLPFYLQDTKEPDKNDKSVYCLTPALDHLEPKQLKSLFKSKDGFVEGTDELVGILKGETGAEASVITASYVPYFIGNPNLKKDGSGGKDEDSWENVGGTVIDPRVTNFVFTDSMNGCAYAITEVKGDDAKFEAWHFQSESDYFSEASHFRATQGIRDWFGVNDYYIGDGKFNAVATNIIWHKPGEDMEGWKMLSQKNVLASDGQGKAEFKESTSHALNVAQPMGEDRVDEVHEKLMTGASKGVKASEVAKINLALQSIVDKSAAATTSRRLVNPSKVKMEKTEATEINKIATRSGDDATRRQIQADLTLFDGLAALKGELAALTTVGRVWDSYDETKTKALKGKFDFELVRVSTAVSKLVTEAKQTIFTTDIGRIARDELLINKIRNIQYFDDVWEEFDEYVKLDSLAELIKSVVTMKKGMTTKKDMLAAEKEEILS